MIDKDILSKGLFITFEGGEGTGKSTQAKILYDYFISNNVNTILTREPGGCDEAEEIRNLLVKGSIDKWDGLTEALMHNAARREHVMRVIKPALLKNKIVICDRFTDSTIAYQGIGQGVNKKFLTYIIKEVTENIIPNITFIFDMDIKNSLIRANKRDNNNRYEKFDINFHKKVRNYFLSLEKIDKRYIIINASNSIESISKIILASVNKIII
ncbi:MAG TPA: dTMP kinase [Alphaproteobacteria bacterium]|jgi:dTMP kinase|nr:dTMP kinase [Alphaproteobacteria bacterium]